MADVKWIKITTDIFDDEKILMLESMPSADSVIVIWFKLLTFAGKQNNDGVFIMSNRIAYTDELLATIFRRDLNTVRMALKIFSQLGMIEIVDNVITIPNWGKHQSLDAYEKKKQRDRERVARKRAEQKALIASALQKSPDMSPDCSPDTSLVVASLEEEKEGDKDKTRKREDIRAKTPDSAAAPSKPSRHKYGQYSNVLLSDEDMDKLKDELPTDWEQRIERLSEYIASSGKSYKNHLATIRAWARKDKDKNKADDGRFNMGGNDEKKGATFNFEFE